MYAGPSSHMWIIMDQTMEKALRLAILSIVGQVSKRVVHKIRDIIYKHMQCKDMTENSGTYSYILSQCKFITGRMANDTRQGII